MLLRLTKPFPGLHDKTLIADGLGSLGQLLQERFGPLSRHPPGPGQGFGLDVRNGYPTAAKVWQGNFEADQKALSPTAAVLGRVEHEVSLSIDNVPSGVRFITARTM